jgi:ATP-dependent DNA helicase RecG
MVGLGLSDRQRQAVRFVKSNGRITSGEYQEQIGAEPRTATRDLANLVEKGVLRRNGQKRGTYYTLQKK